ATTLYPDSNIIQSATYLNQPMRTLGINRLQIDSDRQVALGGKWDAGRLTLQADVSYLDTREQLYYHELDLQTTLPTFSIDTSGSPPAESYSGVDLNDIANYGFAGLTDSVNLWVGRETAVQLDAGYRISPELSVDFG